MGLGLVLAVMGEYIIIMREDEGSMEGEGEWAFEAVEKTLVGVAAVVEVVDVGGVFWLGLANDATPPNALYLFKLLLLLFWLWLALREPKL